MDQFTEYHNDLTDYHELCDSPVFRKLKSKHIQPHQVTVDNSLKVFALELKLKAVEPTFPGKDVSVLLSDQFPGLLENLKVSGRYWVSWYTSNLPENGVTAWPETLKIWNTGSSSKLVTLCAAVSTDQEFTLIDFWQNLVTYFPDAELRFCTIIGEHETLGDRFPGYDPARTTLKNPKETGL